MRLPADLPGRLLVVALNVGLCVLLCGALVHDPFARARPGEAVYGRGDAADQTRAEVLALMERFSRAYVERDVARAGAFVDQLFVHDEPIVLGTLPTEINTGAPAVKQLIRSDWASWGDCRFDVAGARVSSRGDVAWVFTRGRVTFDLSRWLVVPLRLSAVAVKHVDGWRLHQVQFQFDVDLSRNLAALLVLNAWLMVNLGLLGWATSRWMRARRSHASSSPQPTQP